MKKLNKKMLILGLSALLIIGMMVSCGNDYGNKCDPEYGMIGYNLYDMDELKNNGLIGLVDNALLYINENEDGEITISNEWWIGEPYEWEDGKIRERKISTMVFSQKNNKDNQFSDMQYGLLLRIRYELAEEKEELIKQEDSLDKSIYSTVLGEFEDYEMAISNIIEDYNGELSNEDILEIKYHNKALKNELKNMTENIIINGIGNIINNN